MSTIESLKKQRSSNKGKLTGIINWCQTVTDTTIEECKVRVQRVEKLMDEFTAIEAKIFNLNSSEETDMQYEEKYYAAMAKLNTMIQDKSVSLGLVPNLHDTSLNLSNSNPSEVRLPKINITPFSGEYKDWQSFYDIFCATIHKSSLPPSQKFHYLKGYLRGEAAVLVKHLNVTEANYIEALKKLRDRYDRKKHIVNAFIGTFLNQPKVIQASADNVRKLLDISDETIRGLKALGVEGEGRDPWLIYLLLEKVDNETRTLWAQSSADKDFPKLEEFFEFLERRTDALETMRPSSSRHKTYKANMVTGHLTATKVDCGYCNSSEHYINNCPKFCDASVEARRQWVKDQNRCFNCLRDNHIVYKCKSFNKCSICQRKHHSMLHQQASEIPVEQPKMIASNTDLAESTSCSSLSNKLNAILPTAMVNVLNKHGQTYRCRVLLDSGSQVSFVTESLANQLQIPRRNSRIVISGVGNTDAGCSKGILSICVQSILNEDQSILIDALVIPKITTNIPQHDLKFKQLNFLENIEMADPEFFKSGRIDILIGADRFWEIIEDGKIKSDNGNVVAQKTIFGWVITGNSESCEVLGHMSTFNFNTIINVDRTLKKFWEVEEVMQAPMYSEDEEFCEKHFTTHVRVGENQKFIVRLPFKNIPIVFGDSRGLAITRLRAMERKFERSPKFCKLYREFMNEYLTLGHMSEINLEHIPENAFFLPHHGILKDSTTTKLRVVFDASAKSTNGKSLNDYLHVGPTIQPTLYNILLKFREFKIVLSADIEKMYRQIHVAQDEQRYQMIVWRDDPRKPIRYFALKTVTYGTASAPFLATRTIKEISDRHMIEYTAASSVLAQNVYVDDAMFGADTEVQAIELRTNLVKILSKHGFHLRKWVSNRQKVLQGVPKTDREDSSREISEQPYSVKILGLHWKPKEDVFTFSIKLDSTMLITKRTILSEFSRLYDPLGLVAPVIVQIKILFQELWMLHVDWDDDLPTDIQTRWLALRTDLVNMHTLSIPRFLKTSTSCNIQLHGFADASECAYAAAVYFRVQNSDGNVYSTLVTSKTKVAPLKQLSIPRLELCAAVLLVKLLKIVEQTTTKKISEIFAWTDSKIVLDWLSSIPRKWNTFVANRTSEILQAYGLHHWNHISSCDNPADCASRGMFVANLKNFELWWQGPVWLRLNRND